MYALIIAKKISVRKVLLMIIICFHLIKNPYFREQCIEYDYLI